MHAFFSTDECLWLHMKCVQFLRFFFTIYFRFVPYSPNLVANYTPISIPTTRVCQLRIHHMRPRGPNGSSDPENNTPSLPRESTCRVLPRLSERRAMRLPHEPEKHGSWQSQDSKPQPLVCSNSELKLQQHCPLP